MPEIKHNFTKGKMNKDLDERLVPNGEYRDAMNIQVSTSEGSHVGAVQNILGNDLAGFPTGAQDFIGNNATCVGSIADEKHDTLYWFITRTPSPMNISTRDHHGEVYRDSIIKYDGSIIPVFVDNWLIEYPWGPRPTTGYADNFDIYGDNLSSIEVGMKVELVYAAETKERTVVSIYGNWIFVNKNFPRSTYLQGLRFFNAKSTKTIPEISIGTGPSAYIVPSREASTRERVLQFDKNKQITGINIIDSMLFWTDNNSEPKKINIYRSINGTPVSGLVQTRLVVPKNNIDINSNIIAKESHITVIKDSPKTPLLIEYDTGRDLSLTHTGIITITDAANTQNNLSITWTSKGPANDFSNLEAEDIIWVNITQDINGNPNPTFAWSTGTKVVLKEFDYAGSPPSIPIRDYVIKGRVDWADNSNNTYQITISSIVGFPPVVDTSTGAFSLNYAIDTFDESEKIFELKFPRFAYRYKYEDGEYSTYSPFTEVAFAPGSFDYHLTKGYNLGMTNSLTSIKIKDFITDYIPEDVVSIDLLYTEETSPNVYLVDTIKHSSATEDTFWLDNEYEITSDTIKGSTLPSNQLLRPWDNVPRKALSQEIVGNRIIYGNYVQNYDLNTDNFDNYTPVFEHDLITSSPSPSNPIKSIKSLREYQLGVVFIDEYGRETPILSNNTGTFKVPGREAKNANQVQVGMKGLEVPKAMKYFKFFIKETSGEYYNMAMGRWYEAKDDNIWLAFASTDRNKVDLDTVLVLKKGPNVDAIVDDTIKYKILAIENEAPDFIKTSQHLVEEASNANNDVFTATSLLAGSEPVSEGNSFEMKSDKFKLGSGNMLDEITDPLYVEFSVKNTSKVSDRFRIGSITKNGSTHTAAWTKYMVTIDGDFGDIDWMTDTGDANGTQIATDITVKFYKYIVENKPEFDGRFFVKIYRDNHFKTHVINNTIEDKNYSLKSSRMVYLMKKDYNMPTVKESWHKNVADKLIDLDTNAVYGEYNNMLLSQLGTQDYRPQHFHFFNDADGPWDQNLNFNNEWKDYWFIDEAGYQGKRNDNALPNIDFGHVQSDTFADFQPDAYNTPQTAHTFGNYTYTGRADHGINRSDLRVAHDPHINQAYGDGIKHNPNGDDTIMELSFGGIKGDFHYSEDDTGGCKTSWGIKYCWWYNKFTLKSGESQHWNIGSKSGNTHHQDQENFVKDIIPSSLIRWKNDPNNDVYRISKSVHEKQKVRHCLDHRWRNTEFNHSVFPNAIEESYYWWNVEEWRTGHKSPYVMRDNWIKSYKTTIEPQLQWDPTNAAMSGDGSMVGGDIITINATTTPTVNASVGGAIYEYSIDLGTVLGTSATGGDKKIHLGMALQKYHHDTNGADEALPEVLVIRKMDDTILHLGGWSTPISKTAGTTVAGSVPVTPAVGVYTFVQPAMNGFTPSSARAWTKANQSPDSGHLTAVGYELEMVDESAPKRILPQHAAIFETEPKETVDLDIYHEVSGYNHIALDHDNISIILPAGSIVNHIPQSQTSTSILGNSTQVVTSGTINNGNEIILSTTFSGGSNVTPPPNAHVDIGDILEIILPDGSRIRVTVTGYGEAISTQVYNSVLIDPFIYNSKYNLDWSNCYSFGNGIESNRIRDSFNLPYILNGVKASTIVENEYQKEHRKYGLIYSGLYNGISGVNNLNQFIQAEKITKDVNPIYGSIQKLHARDTDLVTLCEDKILRILANKDAVYEADGNSQLTATNRVLGQTVPFVGEFGISKNPESFAFESYRSYFTDKVRGAVMRLSKDGLTPISNHGMKDWFRDNLKLSNKLIGSYDDRNDEYNITLDVTTDEPVTVSFKEDVRGWVSFKSFVPENAISCANDYFTILDGKLYKHYDESVGRNTFYGTPVDSSVNVILNDSPGSVKAFHTLDYEGSQSKINKFTFDPVTRISDAQPYNLEGKPGWHVSNFVTDLEEGSLNEFIEKEGKWFNYLRGKSVTTSPTKFVDSNYDTDSFAIQGIGHPYETIQSTPGCMSTSATNYQPLATADDGSCVYACNANLGSIVSINNVTTTDATSVVAEDGIANIAFTIPADPAWGIGMKLANNTTGALYPINGFPLIDFVPSTGSPNTYSYSDSDITLTCTRNINNCWECNLIALNLSKAEYDFVLEATTSTATCSVDEHFIIDAPPPCTQVPNCTPCEFALSFQPHFSPGYEKVVVAINNGSGPQCNDNYMSGPGACAGTTIRVTFKQWDPYYGTWTVLQHNWVTPSNSPSANANAYIIVLGSGYIYTGAKFKATIRVTPPLGLDAPCESPIHWDQSTPPNSQTYYVTTTNEITWP